VLVCGEKEDDLLQASPLVGCEVGDTCWSLQEVSGDLEISGHPSMDCSWFDDHLAGKVVNGRYKCDDNHTYTLMELSESGAKETTPVPKGPGGRESSGLSTAAKAGIGVGATLGRLALIGLGVWRFTRRRRENVDLGDTGKLELNGATGRALPAGQLPVLRWGMKSRGVGFMR
jgi:hypothetical protein